LYINFVYGTGIKINRIAEREKELLTTKNLNHFFYRTTLCVSAVFAVARCLSVRPSVTVVVLYPHGWRYRQIDWHFSTTFKISEISAQRPGLCILQRPCPP